MKKTISVAAYNRPRNLELLLDSLKNQLLRLDEYMMYIYIDGGGRNFEAVKAIAESVDFIGSRVRCSDKQRGLNQGTYNSISWVMEEEKSDFNVYLEDDFVLSPDAFNLVEWYIEHGETLRTKPVHDVALCSLVNLHTPPGASREEVYTCRGGGMWGFVVSQRQWVRYVKDGWMASKGSWDAVLAAWIRRNSGAVRAFPEVSRVSNTGIRGVHSDPDSLRDRLRLFTFDQEQTACEFRFTGYHNREVRAKVTK